MISFGEKFIETGGRPFEYKGKEVKMMERFLLPVKKTKIRFRFISTSSEYRQGFEIKVDGLIILNGQKIKKGTRIWEDTAPKEDVLVIETQAKELRISNIWDLGDGITQKWHNGGAMYTEEIEKGKRFFCNDGKFDDDFDDLIFEVTIINGENN